jgi:hypothetical protein
MRDYSPILVLQKTHQDVISALEHFASSCISHPIFNDVDEATLNPAPTASVGELTDVIPQSSYTYPVSKQKTDH